MTVRRATAKDFIRIYNMFEALLQHLKEQGNDLYTDDQDTYAGGVVQFIAVKMNDPGSIVLVKANQQDQAEAFLIGWMIQYPAFFKDNLMGEIQWMWPLSFATAPPLRDEFDKWAKENGATGRACYHTPGNTTAGKAFDRDGMKCGLHHYFKSY